ncbi:hypothetical protein ASG63_22530 [Methylobacterium sp. Leaf94]|uniref:hypothetical protein n=1 Tax=Methylobacterium sp. Leaf94 TaxID=1736250 RepID=UPI0006F83DB5|nr:hypothetical protein [Methylobacterium sp. Leaf94]KQU22274.1 hypothetical protein ASG63_22530 [Methylobacterium sp. Leaf94]
MGLAAHTSFDVGLRTAHGLLLGDALLTGALDGLRTHQVTQSNAVETVATELRRVRRLLAGAQADARIAREDADLAARELAAAGRRAAKAEADLKVILDAIRDGRLVRA